MQIWVCQYCEHVIPPRQIALTDVNRHTVCGAELMPVETWQRYMWRRLMALGALWVLSLLAFFWCVFAYCDRWWYVPVVLPLAVIAAALAYVLLCVLIKVLKIK